MNTEADTTHIRVALAAALLVIAIWLGALIYFTGHIDDRSHLNELGDAFGSVNALFSGLAMVGVIIAILLQKRELGLQIEELQKSVKAQEDAAKALSQQIQVESSAVRIRALSALLSSYNAGLRMMEERRNAQGPSTGPSFQDMWPTIEKVMKVEAELKELIEKT